MEGYLPDALNNFIALLGWSHPEGKEILSRSELIENFDLKRLNPAGAVFDPVKLRWMNSQYIKNLTSEQILNALPPFVNQAGYQMTQSKELLLKAIDALRSSFETFQDAAEALKFLDDNSFVVSPESQEVLGWETTRPLLLGWKQAVEAMTTEHMSETQFLSIQDQLKTQFGVKGKHLFMPLRVAVLGKPHGAELKLIVPLLTKSQLLNRVSQL
jgi:nondiscriminating glutamyl-tRNA synthetase